MFKIFRKYLLLMVVVVSAAIASGCCTHRPHPTNLCTPYVSQRSGLQTSAAARDAGNVADFAGIESFNVVQRSLIGSVSAGGPIPIGLDDVISAASKNSRIADLIDAERHSLGCQTKDDGQNAIAFLLQGESLEQRNQSAGNAAKLFMGLVEIDMQRELLVETRQHLVGLAETIREAAEEGFATADGEQELGVGMLELKSAESKLNSAMESATVQLNALINIDSEQLMKWQTVYELQPVRLELDFNAEADAATKLRPSIKGIESALASGLTANTILEMLGWVDSETDSSARTKSFSERIMQRMLSKRLNENLQANRAVRRDQLARVLTGKREQARFEAREAMIKIQSSMERLAIANEKVENWKLKADQLTAKQTLDAKGVYLESNRNWLDLQAAKSERVSAAIAHDSAVIELLQAQGILVAECGSCLDELPKFFDSSR